VNQSLFGLKKKAKRLILQLRYWADYFQFKKANDGRFALSFSERFVIVDDKTPSTPFDRHYLYHPAWAARVLATTKPSVHVDISSILQFSTIVSAFIPIRFYDYRPASVNLSGFHTGKCYLVALPFESGSIKSLSCMHTVEHIGLGRYGDPIDPTGDLKAIRELMRVLAHGGDLLLVVPIGKPKLMFNAHRIYALDQILAYTEGLEVKEFSLIPDSDRDGSLIVHASKEIADRQHYGCGCFWFRRPEARH